MSDPEQIVSKAEFATLCKVSGAAVSQWISSGKLTGNALVGEGRWAKIRVAVAMEQVNLRRDVGQALGNGIATRLARPEPRDADDDEDDAFGGWSGDGRSDDVDRKLKLNKLEAAERANRVAAAEEAASQGLYTETASVRAEMGKIAGQMMRIFEGALPEIATAIASEFRLDARDVTHHLNEQFRKVREQAAAAAAAAAKKTSELRDPTAA